ncbi:MAG TPA: prolipoprotein diacylglyceryl transferase [Bacillota bacterium]|nr:prolipoprotein diacylglyceryl transferase [Bacillota bacterium]
MKPVLFEIYGFAIHSYGLMLAIAFIIGIIGVRKTSRDQSVNPDHIVDLGIWILIGAVVGARIAYVATEYRYFSHFPIEIFKINSGGLAFHGGLIGGFLAGFWYTKKQQLDTWKIADLVTPFIALGYAIVRVGCLLNGCCYGIQTTLPWALRCAAEDSMLRHPTQVYSMLGSLILFGLLWALRGHRQFSGFLFFAYVVFYSVMRFIVEYFREGPKLFPWLSLAQGVCLALAAVALLIIGWRRHCHNQRGLKADAASEIHH